MPRLVIDDLNYREACQERVQRQGFAGRQVFPGCLPRAIPYGEVRHVPKATDFIKPIPREDWPGLIRDGQGTFLHDLTKGILPPHNQGRTNYCWAHGSVRAEEVLGVFEGRGAIILSAESIAVPVTGGRNRGGRPEEALQQLRNHGACEQEYWPLNDRDERHAKSGWESNAAKHKIIRWADVDGFDMQMTMALLRIPVPIGLGWWGHLVCQLGPVHYGGNDFGIVADNSWGPEYGDNGQFELHENRATADLGAFAALTDSFSPQEETKAAE